MAYKFDPVINTYVDPKSVEISKTLNERFAQNFAVNDALETALRDMQYAPFENDSALAKQAREEADAKIKQIAERGDYENMTFPLHTLAKETGNKLKPLADNYSRYANTLTELNKRLEKADINAEQYDLYKGYMIRGYKGLQVDENGRVKQGSEFMPPTLYNDPKIMDRIGKRLEIIHQQKTGRETSGYQRDAEGNLLVIEQGNTLVKVADEDVQKVFDAVMQESDVKMYLDQMSTMKTFKASDAVGGPDQLITSRVENLQDKIGELNNELNSGKYSTQQKNQINQAIKNLQQEIESISTLSTPDQKLNYAKNSIYQEMIKPFEEYANLKAGVYEQTSKYTVKNITAEEKEKASIKWHAENPDIKTLGTITAADVNGKTADEKLGIIQTGANRIAKLEQAISNGYMINEQGQQVQLDASEIVKLNQEIAQIKNDRNTLEAQIEQAARNSLSYSDLQKQDPTLIDAIAEMYGTTDPGKIYLKMQQIFDNPNDQDYLNFQAAFNAKYGENAWTKHNNQYYNKGQVPVNTESQGATMGTPVVGGISAGSADLASIASIFNDDATVPNSTENLSPSNVFKVAFKNKIDKGLLEVKVSNVFTKNKVVTLDPASTKSHTIAFNNFFLGKSLTPTAVYTDGNGNEFTGSNLAGYSIESYYSPDNGGDVMAFDIKGKTADGKDDIRTVYMTTDQITSPELKAVYSTNSFQLARRINQAGNTSSFKINATTSANGYNGSFTLKFDDVKRNGKPLVTIIQADGNPITNLGPYIYGGAYDPSDKSKQLYVTGAMDPSSELFTKFISLPYITIN